MYLPLVFLLAVSVVVAGSLSRRVDTAVSLAAGTALYGALALGPRVLAATLSAFNYTMFNVLASLVLAMALGCLMGSRKEEIASGLSAAGPRFAAFSIPALLGLLSIPGGAYISAVVADPLYNRMGMRPEDRVFLNYWMRHVWIPLWPLFQGVLFASAILGISISSVVERSWPAAVATALAGVLVGRGAVKRVEAAGRFRDLAVLWPLAVVAALSFLPLPLALAVGLTLAAFVAVYRPPSSSIAAAFRYALSPRILAIIATSLIFSEYIKESGLAGQLAALLGGLAVFAAFLIPFAVGLATGADYTFAALAFPPLYGMLAGYNLAVAFLGGILGVMLSPAHGCLVLMLEYYKADIRAVYRRVATADALAAAAMAPIYLALELL